MQVLHLGEQVAEGLGVVAAAPSGWTPGGVRDGQRRLGEHGRDGGAPGPLQRLRVCRHPAGDQPCEQRIGAEQVRGIGPDLVETGLGPAVALGGAVAQAQHPGAGVVEVVVDVVVDVEITDVSPVK